MYIEFMKIFFWFLHIKQRMWCDYKWWKKKFLSDIFLFCYVYVDHTFFLIFNSNSYNSILCILVGFHFRPYFLSRHVSPNPIRTFSVFNMRFSVYLSTISESINRFMLLINIDILSLTSCFNFLISNHFWYISKYGQYGYHFVDLN